jgi:Domain of unknown function (DUF4349)
MRQSEDMPLDPEVFAELEAIDATLAGEPVDPAYAEIAELALLLAATRELPGDEFARKLDARVARRFFALPASASPRQRARAGFSRWLTRPAFASALVGGLAVVAAAGIIASGSLSSPSARVVNGPSTPFRSLAAGANQGSAGTLAPRVTGTSTTASRASGSPATYGPAKASTENVHSPTVDNTANLTQSVTAAPTPAPSTANHVVQSAQLQLSTPNGHIDTVAQEVFNVVALENGSVQHSDVTQAAGGSNGGSYATFSLSIPTSNLQETLTRMSALHYASVSSRTDGAQNVGGQYGADQRHIADQKAVRSALLRQLQTAYTQSAIDSLQAQLKLAERQLSADQAALGSLQHQISYSSLQVQVNAGPIVYPLRTASHGFTVSRAAHDSVRVLVVAAGVALVALAVLVPLGLLALLGSWIGFGVRRRRRRQALDSA